jgi:hypothetical protein
MMSVAKNSYNTLCRHLGTKGLRRRRRHVIGIGGCLQSRSLCSVEELAPKLKLRQVSDKTSNQGHTGGTFSALQTGGRSFPPNAKLQPVLEQAGFTIFQSVSDLGFYGWTPRGSYRILSATTAEEFKEAIDLQARPKQITDAQAIRLKLPIHFEHLAPDEHENRYPYSQYEVASVYVTLKDRQIAKNSIDFCFGGSTLEMLANQRIQNNEMFLVTIVPGTGIILVKRRCDYIQNNSALGFQFERVATGGECADQANAGFINHLQVMKVAGHNVLFSAEADAVDANGDSVEIKASHSLYWGTKTMFRTYLRQITMSTKKESFIDSSRIFFHFQK